VIDDCWNRVGVRGDSSCPELLEHVHCRNCPAYSAAASDVLDIDVPNDYLQHWTKLVALERSFTASEMRSAVVFRIGDERLALPSGILREIADLRTIHSLPHRRTQTILGLVAIRGELLVCVSLRPILGLPPSAGRPSGAKGSPERRLLVVGRDANRLAIEVDEVYGIERYHPGDVHPVPSTLAKAFPTYTSAVIAWRDHAVGLVDDELLWRALERSLASNKI
jgi:chemotaxis-related protein WspD